MTITKKNVLNSLTHYFSYIFHAERVYYTSFACHQLFDTMLIVSMKEKLRLGASGLISVKPIWKSQVAFKGNARKLRYTKVR